MVAAVAFPAVLQALFGHHREADGTSKTDLISPWPIADVYAGCDQYRNPLYRFDTGCPVTPLCGTAPQKNGGMEVSGVGLGFYNNETTGTSGSGMGIGMDAPTGQIVVSGTTPGPRTTPQGTSKRPAAMVLLS